MSCSVAFQLSTIFWHLTQTPNSNWVKQVATSNLNDSPDISKNNNITHDWSLSPEAKPPIKLAKKNWPINFELPKSFPPIVMEALEKRVYMEKKARSKFVQTLYDAICQYTMWVNFFFFFFHKNYSPNSTVSRLRCMLPEVLKLVVVSSCIVIYIPKFNMTTLSIFDCKCTDSVWCI